MIFWCNLCPFFFFRLEKDKSFSQIPPMSFVAPRQAVKRCFPLKRIDLIELELKVCIVIVLMDLVVQFQSWYIKTMFSKQIRWFDSFFLMIVVARADDRIIHLILSFDDISSNHLHSRNAEGWYEVDQRQFCFQKQDSLVVESNGRQQSSLECFDWSSLCFS